MKNLIWKLRLLKDTRGAIMPGVATSISTIFSKIASVMSNAATQGS
jgi:hypothetical protein